MAARKTKTDSDDLGPIDLPDPDLADASDDDGDDGRSPLADVPVLRGLQSLFFIVATYVAMWVLGIATVIQWFWMAITKEKNEQIADFGRGLSVFLSDVAKFQTGESEVRPFPWKKWGA